MLLLDLLLELEDDALEYVQGVLEPYGLGHPETVMTRLGEDLGVDEELLRPDLRLEKP
jgi:hypothetical protein